MIWLGFVNGPAAFWEMHDWLGYGIFLAFYVAVLVTYPRAKPRMLYSPIHSRA
jgi:hypothetical protein